MSPPGELPKTYEFATVEDRWQKTWRDQDHFFKNDPKKPRFIIDTPPPYPTGNFHIGNALNWCYIDFIARYKRMKGFDVMFPQGWDCHGLPTEVKVEETFRITKNDLPREKFREMCRTLTLGNIEKMRATMRRMAFSIDWSHEYITMMPEYYRKTQVSFLKMFRDGYIYQSEHPVNFCTRCETAIAFAEVSYDARETTLNFFEFDGVEIATSRPELLSACVAVAVHPDDERYKGRVGSTLAVPLFDHRVPVIADQAVDPAFGSGAVMICTFGDKQDVFWWKQHGLPLRKAIDRNGRMTATAGKYLGMRTDECRAAILNDMQDAGILLRQEPLAQRVGACWRCKTPIEILSEHQWFVKIVPDEILSAARSIRWTPEHMLLRMENWASQMEWDWCISRQRIFATPIPVWYCGRCGAIVLPDEADLPIDPTQAMPNGPCPSCGSSSFKAETDVLDTWMDSSISVLYVTGWQGEQKPPLFPAQIRPQGHDIIRTWAFYTILRSVAITGEKPWDEILVNGMVLGEDGFKMSKSRGNIIEPEEILVKYGVDALRQWGAAGAAIGSDIMFNWNDVVSASRFQTKLWNIVRFSLLQITRTEFRHDVVPTAVADRWLLARLAGLVEVVSAAMETYQFDRALKSIREFAWDVLADQYIEIVKGRLYQDDSSRDGACLVLETAIDHLCRMMTPFTPYFAEECFSSLGKGSVHTQAWPESSLHDEGARAQGDLLVRVVSEIRRVKHERGWALNARIGTVTVWAPLMIDDPSDASRALNATVLWRDDSPSLERVVTDIRFNPGVVGPRFRKEAAAFMEAVKALPCEDLSDPPAVVTVNGRQVEVPDGAFAPVYSYRVGGEEVEVFTFGDVTVALSKSL
ncbi:MAG: valine--tRNA ligase [Methanomicrobiales archaeon]|nr:valine--tRNA ligase [Methanomicrobiales archaeon]